MRKGTIKRPRDAKKPIIRVTGDAEQYLIAESDDVLVIPYVPAGWDTILHTMFNKCVDTPRNRKEGYK